jgi:hypothetical protein
VALGLDLGSPIFVKQKDILAIVAPSGDFVRNSTTALAMFGIREYWHRTQIRACRIFEVHLPGHFR